MQAWKRKKALMRAPKFTTTFEPMEREVLGELAATVAEALIHRCQSVPKDELEELTGIRSGHKEAPHGPSSRGSSQTSSAPGTKNTRATTPSCAPSTKMTFAATS